jgi:hypothetical protein
MVLMSVLSSRAIMGYLVDQYGKDDSLYPKDIKERTRINQLLYFDMGTLYQRFCDYSVSTHQWIKSKVILICVVIRLHYFVWVWNLVSRIKRRTWTGFIWEQGAEENIYLDLRGKK